MTGKIFMFCLGLAFAVSGAVVDRQGFGDQDLEQMLKKTQQSALLFVRRQKCDRECEKAGEAFKGASAELESRIPGIGLSTATVSDTMADSLGQSGAVGLYCIQGGQILRVDQDDKNGAATIKSLISRYANAELIKYSNETSSGEKFLFLYYGTNKTKHWNDAQLAARLTEKTIHYVTSDFDSEDLELEKKGSFYTRDTSTNSTVRLTAPATTEEILRFIQMSSLDIPQKFDINKLRAATQSGIPVIIIRPDSETAEKNIKETLGTDLEELVKNNFEVFTLAKDRSDEAKTIAEYCTDPARPSLTLICILVSAEGQLLRFLYPDATFEMKPMQRFLERFLDGKIDPFVIEEKIKERYTKTGIRNMVPSEVEDFLKRSIDDNSHRLVWYYNSEDMNDRAAVTLDSLIKEFSDGLLKIARIDLSKNESLDPEVAVDKLFMNGGNTGKPSRVYTGPNWDFKTVRAWVLAGMKTLPVEEIHSEELEQVSINEQTRSGSSK